MNVPWGHVSVKTARRRKRSKSSLASEPLRDRSSERRRASLDERNRSFGPPRLSWDNRFIELMMMMMMIILCTAFISELEREIERVGEI